MSLNCSAPAKLAHSVAFDSSPSQVNPIKTCLLFENLVSDFRPTTLRVEVQSGALLVTLVMPHAVRIDSHVELAPSLRNQFKPSRRSPRQSSACGPLGVRKTRLWRRLVRAKKEVDFANEFGASEADGGNISPVVSVLSSLRMTEPSSEKLAGKIAANRRVIQ